MKAEKLLELALMYGNSSFMDNFARKIKLSEEKDFSNAKLKETLRHKLHPRNIIFCNDIELLFCEVNYSYTTNRNNTKTGKKIFILSNCNHSQTDLQRKLLQWVCEFNKRNPHRQLSNANIISSRYFTDIDEFLALNLNPKQVVVCSLKLNLTFIKMKYKYTTINMNRKESSKIFIYFGSLNPERDMKPYLFDWIEQSNQQNPKKSLLNVKFLKSDNLGYISL